MMKTFRFRDFPVYKDALRFRKNIAEILQKFPTVEKYRLIDQIHRSCLSIILNIAEGSAKQSDMEFARFLEMAIASVNETVAGFDIAFADEIVSEEIRSSIETDAEHLAKQLGGFIKSLRTPKI